jgi:alpha-beta hydrolase superfamily lysophospholipase
VSNYAKDPLCSKQATARWYTEFTAAQEQVRKAPQALAGVPVLALIGEGDRIIDPKISVQSFEALGGADLTLRRYPGLYHELFNELEADRQKVLADTLAWLQGQF